MKDELAKKSDGELRKEAALLGEEQRKLRFDLAAGKVKNVRQVRKNKKRIARLLTVLRERA